MEDKIAVPEALGKYSRPARDFMAPKRQKIEEKMREVPAKEKDGLYAIRVLTEQKLIVQKKITPVKEKILTPDSPLISNLVSPDVSQGTDLAAFDPINSLSKQIQEYPEVSLLIFTALGLSLIFPILPDVPYITNIDRYP